MKCRYIEDIDLSAWGSGNSGCTPIDGRWSAWKSTPCFGSWKIRYRLCNNPSPNDCGQPCGSNPYDFQVQFCGVQLPWDLPRRVGIGMRPTLARNMSPLADVAAPTADTTDVTRQVESALSGLIGAGGGATMDASVFEKALSSVSVSGGSPVRATVRSIPRVTMRPREFMRAPRQFQQRRAI